MCQTLERILCFDPVCQIVVIPFELSARRNTSALISLLQSEKSHSLSPVASKLQLVCVITKVLLASCPPMSWVLISVFISPCTAVSTYRLHTPLPSALIGPPFLFQSFHISSQSSHHGLRHPRLFEKSKCLI